MHALSRVDNMDIDSPRPEHDLEASAFQAGSSAGYVYALQSLISG